jgi:hypothetical protein
MFASMKGSRIHLALAHWKWHTPRVEKLSKALRPKGERSVVQLAEWLFTLGAQDDPAENQHDQFHNLI